MSGSYGIFRPPPPPPRAERKVRAAASDLFLPGDEAGERTSRATAGGDRARSKNALGRPFSGRQRLLDIEIGLP